jgi:hypothetical protein
MNRPSVVPVAGIVAATLLALVLLLPLGPRAPPTAPG